ncbi:histidine phosphatase family protein [Vagococcus hydrophili]|uniref:Histidine phosphatase family protein n=1 Tax=Vagococcus hydrophili TaxID=2714947 RepID=A0A6G8AT91_9ENTE|nr:histidine phosphatase family protein [Vagococcus hydrophili]QIL48189.1 histidine phosphatase family protein [Vagococcus hydrophili]
MRKVYFIRHGLRDTTVKDDMLAPLTEQGRRDVEILSEKLLKEEITQIYTSPFLRAKETIMPLARQLNLEMNVIEELKEREVGSWVKDYQEFTKNQWADKAYKLESGESLNDVSKRGIATFNQLQKKSSGDFVISGHGTWLAVLFNHLTNGEFDYEGFREMNFPDVYYGEFTEDDQFISLKKYLT